ncbi:uncharacterized protein HKW66_Vig0079770 [Vigna angularis]|uniref:Uncharacterized protein n=1 Tax=Phaseolus angularis TaxID=3914 RepID=A0A8T0K592_PHAAN|nr:uncharacterized protein HKW66_Vig0079770 [Vigna angularis]
MSKSCSQMASSSSRHGKKAAHLLRNASPNGWISDDEKRYKFGYLGLLKFVEMTGDCYPDLVQVFYHIVKVVDGVICSQVKGVDIKIDDEIWLSFTGLKVEGFMSHERNSELNQWTNKKKIYKEYLRSPTRLKVYKPYLLDDLFWVHAIKTRIPTNWDAVMSEHMIEIASSHGHILPYGVFISRALKHHQVDLTGEKKNWCIESNEIGKAALRIMIEFERFVVDQFRMLSTRISKVEKSLIMIPKKSDEDNALITPSASESDDEDDTTEVESMETSDSN